MLGAGLMGYGVYEAAQMEDAVYQLIFHAQMEQNDVNRAKFRKKSESSRLPGKGDPSPGGRRIHPRVCCR